MKTMYNSIFAVAFMSIFVLVACQAQKTSEIDSSTIAEIIADPLSEKVRESNQRIIELTTFNTLDFDEIRRLHKEHKNYCTVATKVENNDDILVYAQTMCELITQEEALKAKYPIINDLPADQRTRIFFEKTKFSAQDIQLMLENRKQ